MRLLGVDYGLNRIGIAIGEAEVGMAFARTQMKSLGSPELDAHRIANLAHDEDCNCIVIGMPYLESGEEGEQAKISRKLGQALKELDCNIEFWDERYTTSQANTNLKHLKPEKRKSAADSEAARIMLTNFMERAKA